MTTPRTEPPRHARYSSKRMDATHATKHAETTIAGLRLTLHPTRTAFAPALRTLFAADLHLGKHAAFRAAGIPVPETAGARDLDTLSHTIDATRPEQLVVLGDLVHNRAGLNERTIDATARWRRRHAQLAVTLITGNHDRHAGTLPAEWRIETRSPGATLGPLTLIHDPDDPDAGEHNLAGHLHPAVRLTDRANGTATRLPAFIQTPTTLTLPAFSAFTGTKVVRPAPRDRVFAVCPDAVVPIHNPAPAPR